LSSLANDCGISHNTAKAWLSVLEASFVIFTLKTHYKNFNKRLVKAPKLYFYDTGLLCYLLGISHPQGLLLRPEAGAVFETMVIGELLKIRVNRGQVPNLYFWQDKLGREIDCLIDEDPVPRAVEIKAGQTISSAYFNNLNYWLKLSGGKPAQSFVVYAGGKTQKRSQGTILAWRDLSALQ
jgi:predicted AAA+ superfamily ATPase